MLTELARRPRSDCRADGGIPRSRERSWLAQHGLSAPETLVVVACGLFTIARASMFFFPATLRLSILALVGAPGLVLLVFRAIRKDGPGVLLAAFLLVVLLSGLLSPEPLNSVRGEIPSYMSVLVLWLVGGWWAAGNSLRDPARDLLPWVLVAGVGANALVASFQIALDVQTGPLGSFSGRGGGLMDNAVYYGSLCVGVASWAIFRVRRSVRWRSLLLVAALSFAAGLSGSRAALIVVITVALTVLAVRRCRAAVAALAAALLGFVGASAFISAAGSGQSVTGRVAATRGSGGRLGIWRFGLEAFADRPLFGWGPNQFGVATWRRYTLEFVRDTRWRDVDQTWVDPHNVIVLLLTTVGIVGFGFAVAFVVATIRCTVRWDLFVLVAGIAATWLLQPTRNTLPVAMMVLGAAVSSARGADVTRSRVSGSAGRWAVGLGCVAGVTLAGYIAVGDLRLKAAVESHDAPAIVAAGEWFHRDPAVAAQVAGELYRASIVGEPTLEAALEWSRRAATYSPHNPVARSRYGEMQLRARNLEEAGRALDRAIRLQEWSPSARAARVRLALALGDQDAIDQALIVACDLKLEACAVQTK